MGDILELAKYYSDQGADELVFYDITASPDNRNVDYSWVEDVAKLINIPFCVAGGIRSIEVAEKILNLGADKISINSPAINDPNLITELANRFGSQCVVVGIDSKLNKGSYQIYKFTGSEDMITQGGRDTLTWAKEVMNRGAGEIVLNCIQSDGTKNGYDIDQLALIRSAVSLPLIASGGAGKTEDFYALLNDVNVDGALAASVFHSKEIQISDLKQYLKSKNIFIRMCK